MSLRACMCQTQLQVSLTLLPSWLVQIASVFNVQISMCQHIESNHSPSCYSFRRVSGQVANGCMVTEESGRGKQRMVIGWERGNESMEGPAILAYSAGLSPLVCRLFFPPLFVLELLITSLSPLHCIPHSFVILPRKRIRALSQPPHFSFVSL